MGHSPSHDPRKVIGNIVSLAGGEMVARMLAFAATAHAAAALGPDLFGVVGFAAALVGYATFPVGSVYNDIGGREVARRPAEAAATAASLVAARLAMSAVVLAAFVAVIVPLEMSPTKRAVMAITALSTVSLALDSSWVFRGLEKGGRVSIALILGQGLYATILLLAVRGPGDVLIVPAAQVAGEAVSALLLLGSLVALGRPRASAAVAAGILRMMRPALVARFLRTVVLSFGVVLLGLWASERDVGLYTAPYRICLLLLALGAVTTISYLPAVTRAADAGMDAVASIAARSLEVSAAVAAPVVVGGCLLAAPLLEAVFGLEYVDAAPAFRLLLLGAACALAFGTARNVLLAIDRVRLEASILAAAAACSVGLNVVLVPRFAVTGAAAATAATEAAGLLLGIFAVRRCGVRLGLAPVLKPLLAAFVMGAGLATAGGNVGVMASVLLGAGLYIVALWAIGGIPRDVRPFAETFRRGESAKRRADVGPTRGENE